MKLISSWRLSIALAAIALLAAFAALPGSGPRSAEADVDTVTPEVMYADDGSTIDIDIAGNEDADSGLSVSANGTSTLAIVSCDDEDGVDCGIEVSPGNPVSWDDVDGPYTATVALTLDCSDVEAITITATHNGDSTPVATVYCVPELSDPDVEIEKQSDDDNEEYDFDWDASGGDCLVIADDGTVDFGGAGSFDLEDNDEADFYCENSVNLEIDEVDDGDFVEIDGCDGDDGVDISGSSAEFDISDLDDTAFCVWVNDEDFTPAPPVGPVTSVSIFLSDKVIECGGSTLVQIVPRSSGGGPAPAGTVISLTSSLGGNFQPASSITSAFPIGLANFLYTAPDDVDGITTITARAGNVQQTAAVEIVCEEAAPPTATPAPLQPPSAGSGGLVGSSGSTAYVPAALAVAAAAAVLGLTAVSRRFATAPASIAEAISEPVTAQRQPRSFALLLSLALLLIALMSRRWR